MQSGKFIHIEEAEKDAGIAISGLIRMGSKGDLSIYAWDIEWVCERTEYPFNRYNFTTPVLMDVNAHLETLAKGKSVSLESNAEHKVICYRDSTDDNHLDGVEVTQRDLYCLKSEIEDLKHKDAPVSLEATQASEGSGVQNDSRGLMKLEKQQDAIMKVVQQKGYNPLAVPDGGKITLKMICEADYPDLFDGKTSFDNAWKESRSLFRMANHASYSKMGKI